jgi:hypothetical protein
MCIDCSIKNLTLFFYRLHGQILMFILFSYKTIAPTYVFVQAIGHYAQGDDNVIQSTKLLRIILDALYDYVVR